MADKLAAQIAALASKDPSQQAAAAEALARMGAEAQPAAVALVKAMCGADAPTREWCAASLEELGAPAAKDIKELASLARDQSPDVAYWAITLLGRAGNEAGTAVATLAEVLSTSSETSVRERAAWALGKIGPAAKAAIPMLQLAAAGGEPRLARLATDALQSIGK